MGIERREAHRRITAALKDAGHHNDRKEYVLWPSRTPSDSEIDEACDDMGLYLSPKAILDERERRGCNGIVEVYVFRRQDSGPYAYWELDHNVEIDIEANEYSSTDLLNRWVPIPGGTV